MYDIVVSVRLMVLISSLHPEAVVPPPAPEPTMMTSYSCAAIYVAVPYWTTLKADATEIVVTVCDRVDAIVGIIMLDKIVFESGDIGVAE